MSFAPKPQRVLEESNETQSKNSMNAENPILINGFQSIRQKSVGKHPLEALERTHRQRIDNKNYLMLKSIQGIHAPLRLIHERRAAQSVGRLPFLHSSNVMLEVLDGRDELIGVEDIFNDVSQPEVMAPPHMTTERELQML